MPVQPESAADRHSRKNGQHFLPVGIRVGGGG